MRDSVPSGSYSSVCNVLRQWKSRSSLLIESTNSMILYIYIEREREREGKREGGRKGGKEGRREGEREGGRERGGGRECNLRMRIQQPSCRHK